MTQSFAIDECQRGRIQASLAQQTIVIISSECTELPLPRAILLVLEPRKTRAEKTQGFSLGLFRSETMLVASTHGSRGALNDSDLFLLNRRV